jgi:hypothetical protein
VDRTVRGVTECIFVVIFTADLVVVRTAWYDDGILAYLVVVRIARYDDGVLADLVVILVGVIRDVFVFIFGVTVSD